MLNFENYINRILVGKELVLKIDIFDYIKIMDFKILLKFKINKFKYKNNIIIKNLKIVIFIDSKKLKNKVLLLFEKCKIFDLNDK